MIEVFPDKQGKDVVIHATSIEPINFDFLDQEKLNPVFTITKKIVAEVVDTDSQVIVDAVIKCAMENGVNDIWLLDRKFVLDALREKMERDCYMWGRTCADSDHDVSGLTEED